MAHIELFEDQTIKGTYSQIRTDDGKRIFISLTQTELAFSKVIFGIPLVNLMDKINVYKLMDLLYPHGPKSSNFNESLLSIVTQIALESAESIGNFNQKFWKNVEAYNTKIKSEGEVN